MRFASTGALRREDPGSASAGAEGCIAFAMVVASRCEKRRRGRVGKKSGGACKVELSFSALWTQPKLSRFSAPKLLPAACHHSRLPKLPSSHTTPKLTSATTRYAARLSRSKKESQACQTVALHA
ncbi:hypothetical protein L1887_57564 [Cichorium endivia]|nr:hypothetical protein L1887_57564 [Cichorium endivia]